MHEFEGQTTEPGLPEEVFSFIISEPWTLYYVSQVINSQRVSKSAVQTRQECIVVPEPWHRSHLGIRPGTACFPNAVNTSPKYENNADCF